MFSYSSYRVILVLNVDKFIVKPLLQCLLYECLVCILHFILLSFDPIFNIFQPQFAQI